jgi:hypothetical protein
MRIKGKAKKLIKSTRAQSTMYKYNYSENNKKQKGNKIGNVYSLEYIEIPKVFFFMPHHR